MPEETHQAKRNRGRSRRERVEIARSRDILDVANELNMELVRSGRDYRWKEHDSLVISPDNNKWNWFSRQLGGDVIALVETMKEIGFNQAIDYLNDGSFKEYTVVERVQEPFRYYLEPYEQDFVEAKKYLTVNRGLSEETIDFFLKEGVLAQANAMLNNSIEPVVVFKTISSGEITGATLQGIEENWKKWPERGYAKNIIRNSDGMDGLHVDIGKPNRLVFTESPIDLMSYYEINKNNLSDVRLISMDGLKEATIGRHLAQLQSELSGRPLNWTPEQLAEGLQTAIDNNFFADGRHQDMITLAVDNDEAGQTFLKGLSDKGVAFSADLPPLEAGQDKMDWNDYLKAQNESVEDNSRLAQARRKLERLKGELDTSIQATYDHQSLTNGQPMNDKRDGNRFFRKQSQLEDKIFDKMDEIKRQEERIEQLEWQEENKQMGLNRQGTGLEMSIQNIPRIREEIERADRGESTYTAATIKRYKQELAKLEAIQEKTAALSIQPGAQALIDADEVNQWQKRPNTYFVKGLRRVALELNEEGNFEMSSNPRYQPKTEEDQLKVTELLDRQKEFGSSEQVQVDDKTNLWTETIEALEWNGYKWDDVKFIQNGDVDISKPYFEMLAKQFNYDSSYGTELIDRNLVIVGDNWWLERAEYDGSEWWEYKTLPKRLGETQEKSLENLQETKEVSEHQKNERTNGSQGSLQPEAEGSPTPAPEVGTFERSVTSRPTLSSHLLHFTINEEFQSSNDGRYHAITPSDLAKLNRTIRLQTIQNAAQYYLDELANSRIFYVTPDKIVQVSFEEKCFMHLTGIKPIAEGQTAEKTLHDFAEGNGHFDNILLANNDAAFDKLNVLSDLSVATESKSFYFDDLSDIRRYNGRFDSLIKSDDKDIILLFKELEEDSYIPVSVFQARNKLTKELGSVDKTPILGVYREREGQIEQLSINEEFISDGGEEMLANLKNQVTSSEDTLNQEVAPSPLPDDYHVRLQWSEEWPNSPRLPFEEQSLIPYEDFVMELYKVNQAFYPIHHESVNQSLAGNSDAYRPFTKIKFDIYSPSGQVVKEGVRYNIGDETEPVSRLLGLGYRRLEGQPELAAIDERVLAQLENQTLNQVISQEANNPQKSSDLSEGAPQPSPAEEKESISPKQETKSHLTERVNEILAESQKAAEEPSPLKSVEVDYGKVAAYELSEIAFQKIREFTQSPEALAEYMDFMSQFPQLSPRNVALIKDQWPGANAVATFNQWQAMGKTLGIKAEDVIETRNEIKTTYTNKRTGESKEVVRRGLSVKAGEKSQITLFRPLMAKMIPVLDEQGRQLKNEKGNPKFKKISEASPHEKALLKEGKLKVVQFQERDFESGQPKFTTYKVFELSQTNLKPENYPKAMPNRHYQFDTDQVKTKEVLDGLCDYAGTLGVRLLRDELHELGNAKGAFYPGDQKILLNPDNLPGEQIATTIHELAHATLHNPKFTDHYKNDVSKPRKELEAEMTSHLVSKHFGLDTGEKAIHYIASWTKNLTELDDKQLAESMKRIHQTVSKMVKHIEHHTKPYQPPKDRGQSPNFPQSPTKGLKP